MIKRIDAVRIIHERNLAKALCGVTLQSLITLRQRTSIDTSMHKPLFVRYDFSPPETEYVDHLEANRKLQALIRQSLILHVVCIHR
jgi:hypothetical protein